MGLQSRSALREEVEMKYTPPSSNRRANKMQGKTWIEWHDIMAWLVTFNDDSSMYKLLYRVTSPQTRSNAPLQVAWTRDSWYCRQDHHSGPSWEPSNGWSVGQWDLFPTQWPSPRGSWLALDALSTVYNTKVVDVWHLTASDSAHALSTLKINEWDVQFWNLELWNLTPWHLRSLAGSLCDWVAFGVLGSDLEAAVHPGWDWFDLNGCYLWCTQVDGMFYVYKYVWL